MRQKLFAQIRYFDCGSQASLYIIQFSDELRSHLLREAFVLPPSTISSSCCFSISLILFLCFSYPLSSFSFAPSLPLFPPLPELSRSYTV